MRELLKRLKNLNLPKDQYAIFGSGPLAIRGLKKADNLEIVVKLKLFDELIKSYKQTEPGLIEIDGLKIYADWKSEIDDVEKVINQSEEIAGFKFVTLKDLIKWKRKRAYQEDYFDIGLIKDYLKGKRKKAIKKIFPAWLVAGSIFLIALIILLVILELF